MKNNSSLEEFLAEFGLTEKEINIYKECLKQGRAIVKDIARGVNLNRTTTYVILQQLAKKSLVHSSIKNKIIYYSPSEPSQLKELLNSRIEKQEKLLTTLYDLLPTFQGMYNSKVRGADIQVYEGVASLPHIYKTLYQSARFPEQAYEFTNWGGKYKLFPQQFRQEMIEIVREKNININSILVEDEMTRKWVKTNQGRLQNKNIKLIKNPGWDFFINLEFVQNKIAIVTYKNESEFQGYIITSTEFSAMFKFLFTTVWSTL